MVVPHFSPGKAYYLAPPKKEDKKNGLLYSLCRRKNKKILCNDGITRRFCNGVLTWWIHEHFLPVMCCECNWDFNFYDICEKTMPFIKEHTCNKF